MTKPDGRIIAVTGATGLQGRAVTRQLIESGWRVRGLTRNAGSERAQALKALGAELVQGDMNDVASLRSFVEGVYGLYSVQNPYISGVEAEVAQGRNVGDVAKQLGISHFIYGSAGVGRERTGVPSWETKLRVEKHLKELALPLTILRPTAFMDIMTEKKFFPPAAAWRVMPALMGWSLPIGWLSSADLGAIVAKAFAAPDEFVGRELSLAADVQSLDQCRTLYREVMGKNPPRFPMPVWLFERFGLVGRDLTTMWRWLREARLDFETATARAILPDALTVREWLAKQAAGTFT